jgi:hypothetical protein
MTDARDLFSAKNLASGVRVIPQFNRNQNELGLRSYEADISFEEPVELHDTQVLPYRVLPHLPELPNNEVKSLVRKLFNPVSTDEEVNYYIASFLIHKGLEKEKQQYEENSREESYQEEPEQTGKEKEHEEKKPGKPAANRGQSVDELVIPTYMQNLIFN